MATRLGPPTGLDYMLSLRHQRNQIIRKGIYKVYTQVLYIYISNHQERYL